ncbi:hypothetical protein [Streptomyces sp. So13.3]|uniref:hypothetical protein n=1 Tax=Streptomyces sp. So13.3 TaxID=2136173 RepID=UPI0031FCC7F5
MTLPRSGSMRGGALFARPMSAPPTSATGYSSSPGLPTPAARDWRGGGQSGQLPTAVSLLPTPSTSEATGAGHAAQGGMNLRHVVSLLPTPRASANENRQTKRSPSQEAGTHGLSLAAEVCSLLPTPAAADADRTSTTYGRGNPTLKGALLPTPRASDGDKGGPNQRGSKGDLTLPSAAHRIGAPTAQPSLAGNTSAGAPLPLQPTLWDA